MKPVVIACGGMGTRLHSTGQKCLHVVHGRPFLYWKLDQLAGYGATEFHLLVGHMANTVRLHVRYEWDGIPVYYHYDTEQQRGPHAARIDAVQRGGIPFVYWFTYGDCLLDVELRHSKFPYMYTNDEFERDAGIMYCWGQSSRWLRRYTDQPSYHINTPTDLERTHAYLRRHRRPGRDCSTE